MKVVLLQAVAEAQEEQKKTSKMMELIDKVLELGPVDEVEVPVRMLFFEQEKQRICQANGLT